MFHIEKFHQFSRLPASIFVRIILIKCARVTKVFSKSYIFLFRYVFFKINIPISIFSKFDTFSTLFTFSFLPSLYFNGLFIFVNYKVNFSPPSDVHSIIIFLNAFFEIIYYIILFYMHSFLCTYITLFIINNVSSVFCEFVSVN